MENTSIEKIIKNYYRFYPDYSRLGENVKESLVSFLKEKGIKLASIEHRVKDLDSFLMKIKRKKYVEPFEQMEDFCGIRVVCFFQSDIEKIEKVIKKEFELLSKEIKENSPTKFGYRSNHLIIKVKNTWINTPNYRGLQDLKIEVQARTILMHAWAEIEHKLAYKKTEHIPDEFRERFSSLSAKLEEVDEQFEKLANDIKEKNRLAKKKSKKEKKFDDTLLLNLDTIQLFLDYFFPNKQKNIRNTRDLLDEAIFAKLTLKDLVKIFNRNTNNLSLFSDENNDKDKVQTDEFRKIIDVTKKPN